MRSIALRKDAHILQTEQHSDSGSVIRERLDSGHMEFLIEALDGDSGTVRPPNLPPLHRALAKVEDRAEQKSMANSTQQARNVDGSLAVSPEPLPGGPVLLVDDMVDSRWTLTVAAWLLRSNGSGEVWPLALALTSHG